MKKYLYLFIIFTAILGIANMAKALECSDLFESGLSCGDYCRKNTHTNSDWSDCWNWCDECWSSKSQQQQQQSQNQQPATEPPPATNPPPSPVQPITPTLTAGATAGISLNTQYFGEGEIQPGDTITSPADKNTNIVKGGQKIDLKAGSVIKYVNKTTWQLIRGVAHFVKKLDKIGYQSRHKVIAPDAVCTIRGTQFTVDATTNGQTIITVTKGTVNVAPTAKGKKAVDVKEGFQLTVGSNGATAKPTKIDSAALDTWYESIPANSAFFDSSWNKEVAANRYRRECVFTAAAATPTMIPTADEQKIIDAVNQGILSYHAKISDLVMEKDKKISSAKERTNVDGTVAMQLYVNGKNIYYPGDKAKTWKTYQDKKLADNLFKMIRKENLTYDFDKNTFTFTNWEGAGKNRLAVYSGKLTSAGTGDVISSATGQSQEAGQPVGTAKIYIDEESQLWNKAEVTVNVQSGKLIIPIFQNCQITYGNAVKVVVPSKAKKVDAKTGNTEFSKAVSSVR